MPGVYAPRTDHRALAAELAGLQHPESLVRLAVVYALDSFPEACRGILPSGADRGTAAAGHALADIRLH